MSVASRRFSLFMVATALAAVGLFGAAQSQTLVGASGPAGDAGKVEKCDAPKGMLAVVEPQDAVLQVLSRIGLQSPTDMIRLIAQQSNCFQIVERGAAFQNMMQERALSAGGQLQAGQNVGQGQMVAANFVITPSVVFSNPNAGGIGGGPAGLGGYTNTAEGKIVSASFLNNGNKIVLSVRDNPSLIQARGSTASQANAAGSVKAGAGQVGDIHFPKIAGVKAYRSACEGPVLATLSKSDELIYGGEEIDGFMKVKTGSVRLGSKPS